MNLDIIKTDLFKKFMKENNLTVKKFCKLCKISQSTLYKIFKGENFIIVALFKIARVMHLEVYQLVKD